MSDFYKALASAIYLSRQQLAGKAIETDDEKIRASGLYDDWEAGDHKTGEIYNAAVNGKLQTWECYANYDNAVYPDIVPGNAAWYTFNRPLHGKTRETARDWVQPTHSMDIYKLGEWMFYPDGFFYECIAENGTSFSPEEYADAWRREEFM